MQYAHSYINKPALANRGESLGSREPAWDRFGSERGGSGPFLVAGDQTLFLDLV